MSNIRVDSTGQLPSIGIARRDHARLERLADDAVKERHPVGSFLMSEIRRAVVFDSNQVPDGTVRLNEWVTYRVDGGRQSESKIWCARTILETAWWNYRFSHRLVPPFSE